MPGPEWTPAVGGADLARLLREQSLSSPPMCPEFHLARGVVINPLTRSILRGGPDGLSQADAANMQIQHTSWQILFCLSSPKIIYFYPKPMRTSLPSPIPVQTMGKTPFRRSAPTRLGDYSDVAWQPSVRNRVPPARFVCLVLGQPSYLPPGPPLYIHAIAISTAPRSIALSVTSKYNLLISGSKLAASHEHRHHPHRDAMRCHG